MRLPEIAARLRELAQEYEDDELAELAAEIGRRRSDQRAPPTSRKMTPELAASIRAFARDHPNWSQVAIGRQFNVNGGRVSEALHGKRT